ncbi:hypothetical protein C9Z88_01055 [Escherichia coli]|nr:hypothetical protein C9Z88_01055 [Escherichia coli]
MNYGRRVGKCCLSAFKIATKSNHKSRLQHIFLIYIQIMTLAVSLGVIIYASGGSVTKRNRTKSSAVNKAIRFRSH